MSDELRDEILARNDAMSRDALRVLAVCERMLPNELTDYTPDTVETDLTFLGLVGMIDPPRPEVAEAVEHALTAGIRIIMVTGDYGLTAEAIARRIGIVRGDKPVRVITGVELERWTEDDLKAELDKPQDVLFARVAPEHKMRVVSALKEMKQIVAVTGDGVNDAPALKKADIGVAMGLSGTDVSREAAVMILLDDSFASIIKAVEQGRGVYANVKKMVTYIFSHNMAELFPFVFASLAGVGLVPLGALQVLAIDLGSDVLPGLALGTEHPEPGVMKLPPRSRKERLLSNATLKRVVFIGAIQSSVGRGRLPLRALLARLALGRRHLDDAGQRALPLLSRGADHDAGDDRHVPGRQRFRLPHRARIALQGRPVQEPLPGRVGRSSASASSPPSRTAVHAGHLQDRAHSRRSTGACSSWRRFLCSSPKKRENGSYDAGRRKQEDEPMHVIIVGCGRVGASTAAALAREGHEVVVIDQNDAVVSQAARELHRPHARQATPTTARRSRRPASARPTHWWPRTAGDNTNAVTARVAKEVYRVPDVVSRIYDPLRADIYRRYGVQTFAPTAWSVGKIVELIVSPNVGARAELRRRRSADDRRLGARRTWSASPSPTCACRARFGWRSSCAWARACIPVSGTTFEEDDQIHVMVHQTAIERFQKMMGWKS